MNNFDMSSSGVNLSLVINYDQDRSQTEFSENFKRLATDGSSALNMRFSRVGTLLFTNCGQVDPDNYTKSKVVAVRGYSQGDYVEVIVPTNTKFPRGFNFEEYFTKLIYSAPIYARLQINGVELYLDECLSDSYDYVKSEVMIIVGDLIDKSDCDEIDKGQKSYILNWLESALPENLEYV